MVLFNNKIKTILAAIFFLPLLSCGNKFFPEFKIQNAEIDGQKIIVQFSAPVNAVSIKENFFFTQDGNAVKGEFLFNGNNVEFFPENLIEENHCYEVVIYTGAEDTNGNSLEEEYKKRFYTKKDFSCPKIIGIENIVDAEEKTRKLKIQFNKKMDRFSFEQNFSIAPSATYIFNWNENQNLVEVIFLNDLKEKTFYSVQIENGAKDAVNNFFENKFLWSFENTPNYIELDFSAFAFSYNTKNYVELDSDIVRNFDFSMPLEIKFNKKIIFEKIEQAIFIEPQLNFSVDSDFSESGNYCDFVKIIFQEQPKWNSTYRFYIDSIYDDYGSKTMEKSFALKNDSEALRPPKFEFMLVELQDGTKLYSEKNNYDDLLIDSTIYQPGKEYSIPLYFIFSISSESECINEFSAMEAISIDAENSCAKIIPTNIHIYPFEEMIALSGTELNSTAEKAIQTFDLQDANLVCVKLDTQLTNGESDSQIINGIVNFKIAKTLCDNNKNYMEEAVQISCNKM